MNEQAHGLEQKKAPIRRAQRKSDGQDGPPVSVLPVAPVNTPGAPNAALKEPPPKPGEGVDPQHPFSAHLIVQDAEAGLIGTADGAPRRRRIAICGFASSTRKYILKIATDKYWEIFGLNQLYRHIPRADLWCDLHWNWDQETVPDTDHRKWAQECGMPFFTLHRQPDIPTNVKYPIDAILKEFKADYFTSTIAYLVAFAIWEIDARVAVELHSYLRRTPKTRLLATPLLTVVRSLYSQYQLALFGIDLTVGEEYFHEKACAEYWLGQASARDIQVLIPPESALCKQQYRYGYERTPTSLIRVKEIIEHKAALEAERNEKFKQLMMLEGAMECDERWRQVAELRERGTTIE